MSSLSQFTGGSRPPKLLVQGNAVAGYTPTVTGGATIGGKTILSGDLSAGVLSTALVSVSGSGELAYLEISAVDTTSRTLRLELTIDGTVVYDYTSAANTTVNNGAVVVGANESATAPGVDPINFNSSLVIKVASSLAETNLVRIRVKYRTY